MCSYLTATSSVNLSTRWVRMLRGMVPALSGRRGGLLFRHAGRVELGGGVASGPAHERVKNKKNGAGMHREAKKNQIKGKKHMQEADLSRC